MGMYGEWLRATADELERAKADLDWAYKHARSIGEAEYSGDELAPLTERRSFGTDKTWDALAYLLRRHGFPIMIVYGEEAFIECNPEDEDPSVDWGYGPPRYLTPQQVHDAAVALAGITQDELIRDVDPAELDREGIYPQVWGRPGELEWAVCHLPEVKEYFDAAADNGDAMICWIS